MFNSSLRRVARSCPNASVPTRPTTPHSSITVAFTTQCHQRRHSSSKPPIPPNNGSPTIPTTSVKQVGAPRSDKRPTSEARLSKRKASKGEKPENTKQQEETISEWTKTLPSVPSTQHLNPKDVYVASFFSTHRPISITGPLPPETKLEDVEKIFQAKLKPSRRNTQDVIYTINSAVQNLDEHISNHPQASQHEESVSQRADIIKALTQHNNGVSSHGDANNAQGLDGQPPTSLRVPGNVKLVIQEFARRFRPFNVPPAPQPVPELDLLNKEEAESSESKSTNEVEAEANEEFQAKQLEVEIANQPSQPEVQHVILNAPQQPQDASSDFFTSHIPKSKGGRTRRGLHSASDLRRIKLTGLSLRQKRQPGSMQAISVRRQRKIKMKKHKLRKLRKRTRNLRRREGKI